MRHVETKADILDCSEISLLLPTVAIWTHPLCGHREAEAQITGYHNNMFTCYNIMLLPLTVNLQSSCGLNMKFLHVLGHNFLYQVSGAIDFELGEIT